MKQIISKQQYLAALSDKSGHHFMGKCWEANGTKHQWTRVNSDFYTDVKIEITGKSESYYGDNL